MIGASMLCGSAMRAAAAAALLRFYHAFITLPASLRPSTIYSP
jgi:hypothetical protein